MAPFGAGVKHALTGGADGGGDFVSPPAAGWATVLARKTRGRVTMYAEHTTLQIIGQLLIAVLFLGTGLINATIKVKQHVDRMAAMGIPSAAAVLWTGFAMQFVGGLLIAFDTYTAVGAVILIVFTIVATAIFHRYWEVEDPLRRHLHQSFIFSNCAVLGGLTLLI